ncbi:MAG: energy transducer TonB [Bryobacteraceae bacterium]|jgi:periplasmic protein TonB
MAELEPNNPRPGEVDHLSRLLVAEVEEPFYKTFWRDLKETISPPKLPPLEVTSKPVAVKDIWGLYGNQKKSFMMSFGFQIGLVLFVVLALSTKPVQKAVKSVAAIVMPVDPVDVPKPAMHGGGGGGDRSPLPASKGKLPKPQPRQFVPPTAVINNPAPKLAMDPSILAPPDANLPNINLPNYGDPLGKLGPASNGTGSGGGIGSGKGGGVGSGSGGGVGPGSGGGIGDGVYRAGNGVTKPELLKKVEPEYSEEARKAKFQGVVVLYIVVDPNGNAINPRVMKSLGLGLDEKAMEAVKQWKFKPGYKDGKAVAVAATVEVNFRLL